jgi:hypothetical protein
MSEYSTANRITATGRNQSTPDATTTPIHARKLPTYSGLRVQAKIP